MIQVFSEIFRCNDPFDFFKQFWIFNQPGEQQALRLLHTVILTLSFFPDRNLRRSYRHSRNHLGAYPLYQLLQILIMNKMFPGHSLNIVISFQRFWKFQKLSGHAVIKSGLLLRVLQIKLPFHHVNLKKETVFGAVNPVFECLLSTIFYKLIWIFVWSHGQNLAGNPGLF